LRIDEPSRRIVVRIFNTRTGATIREFPVVALTAVAARVGRMVA
jgi:hypothetical protein